MASGGVDCEALRAKELPNLNETYVSPEERPVGAKVDLAIFILGSALLLVGVVTFGLAKFVIVSKRSEYWRYFEVRFFVNVVLTHFGAFLSLVCATLPMLVPYNTFPCWLSMCVLFVPAFLAVPPAVRYFTLYRQFQISKAAAESAAILHSRNTRRGSMSSMVDYEDEETPLSWRTIFLALVWPSKLSIEMSSKNSENPEEPDANSQSDAARDFIAVVKVLKLLSSMKGMLLILALCIFPYAILLAITIGTSEFARSGCNTCTLPSILLTRVFLYIGAVVPLSACVLSFYLVRKLPDALYVIREIRFGFIFFGIPAVVFMIVSSFTFRKTDFSLRFFYQLCILGFCLCQSLVPALAIVYAYLKDGQNKRRRSRVVNADAQEGRTTAVDVAEFEHVLSDPILHDAFMTHLTMEHSVESLRFHDEVEKWTKQYFDTNQRTSQVRAKKIVSLFVGDDAVFPVNLPSSTIESLRASVGLGVHGNKKTNVSFKRTQAAMQQLATPSDNIREIDQHFFEEADRQIKELMRLDAFARFRKTKKYRDLISIQDAVKPSVRHTVYDSPHIGSSHSDRA